MRIILLLLLSLWSVPAARADAGPPLQQGAGVAFFGMTYIAPSADIDYGMDDSAERARIALVEEEIRKRFRAEGFNVIPVEPSANPSDCKGCAARMAADLGADYALVGRVQKVSNLILSITLVMGDAQTGTPVRARAVDIRSNTDDSWLRGVRYILDHAFFPDPGG